MEHEKVFHTFIRLLNWRSSSLEFKTFSTHDYLSYNKVQQTVVNVIIGVVSLKKNTS